MISSRRPWKSSNCWRWKPTHICRRTFRQLTGEIVILIAEFPTDEIMDDLALETPFDLLGLFEGRGIAERWNPIG